MSIHVAHIIESFGSGTLTALINICTHTKNIRYSVLHAVRPETPVQYASLFPKGTSLHKIGMMRRAIHPYYDSLACAQIILALKKLRPNLVHCHSSKAGALGRIAARLLGLPSVYTPHSYSFLQDELSPLWRHIYWGIEKMATKLGTAIAACGKEEYDLARGLGGEAYPAVLIKNAVDMALMESISPAHKEGALPYIGMSGRYAPQRNPELFAALASRFADQSFWLWIGADRAGSVLPENVVTTGWQPRLAALSLVASLDIYIQTSLWEGLSFGILEAMALGKPIVASRIPANETLVEHGVTGFLAADEEDFSRHLAALIASPELRRRMGNAAKERIRNDYDMVPAAKAFADLYHSLAQKAG